MSFTYNASGVTYNRNLSSLQFTRTLANSEDYIAEGERCLRNMGYNFIGFEAEAVPYSGDGCLGITLTNVYHTTKGKCSVTILYP